MYDSGHQSTELAISIKNKGEVKEIVHVKGWGELLEWGKHFAKEQQDKILKSFLGDSLLQRDHQGGLMDFGSCFCCKKTACFYILLRLRKISFLMTLAQCINGSITKRLYRSFFTSTEQYQEMEIYKIIRFCCLYFICFGAVEDISSNWVVYVAM